MILSVKPLENNFTFVHSVTQFCCTVQSIVASNPSTPFVHRTFNFHPCRHKIIRIVEFVGPLKTLNPSNCNIKRLIRSVRLWNLMNPLPCEVYGPADLWDFTPQNPSCCRICHAINSFTYVQSCHTNRKSPLMANFNCHVAVWPVSRKKSHHLRIIAPGESPLSRQPFPCPNFTTLYSFICKSGDRKRID